MPYVKTKKALSPLNICQYISNCKGHCPFSHPPFCRRFIKGSCLYGINGKGCSHFHPKYYHKCSVYGLEPKYKCTKGNTCAFFGTELWQNPLSLTIFLNLECTAHYLKGTKWKQVKLQQKSERKTKRNNSPLTTNICQKRNNNKRSTAPHKTKQTQKVFLLDYLESMKASPSLEMEWHISKTLGVYTYNHQAEHHSIHTSPHKLYQQCCQ